MVEKRMVEKRMVENSGVLIASPIADARLTLLALVVIGGKLNLFFL